MLEAHNETFGTLPFLIEIEIKPSSFLEFEMIIIPKMFQLLNR